MSAATPAKATSTAPAWKPYQQYLVGGVVTYDGLTYQALQAETSNPSWDPLGRHHTLEAGVSGHGATGGSGPTSSGRMACHRDLYCWHDRHGQWYHLSGELVDGGQQSAHQQWTVWQWPALDAAASAKRAAGDTCWIDRDVRHRDHDDLAVAGLHTAQPAGYQLCRV